MRIAICDDNHAELLEISQMVDKFINADSAEHSITSSTFQSGLDLLAVIEKGASFDIFLLDIVMPLINGIELAKEIRKRDAISKIIFLTTSRDYAVDSYGVNAFYYLLKPVKEEELLPLLKKASETFFDQMEKHIIVKRGVSLSKIFLHKILFAEIIGRTVSFYLKNGETLESLATMTQVEAVLLTDKRFVKTHRSYVVNMDCIKSIAPEGITTVSGAFIPISRNNYKEVKQTYIDYLIRAVKAL